nr:MAG TPA: hypothetical protein [Caudoviricetes sp.]
MNFVIISFLHLIYIVPHIEKNVNLFLCYKIVYSKILYSTIDKGKKRGIL